MKRLPAPASQVFSVYVLHDSTGRDNNYYWGGQKFHLKSSLEPMESISLPLLYGNNKTIVDLSVASHDSMKNRWIANKLIWRHLVEVQAPASSLLHTNLRIPRSHALFILVQECVWKPNWWQGIVHMNKLWEVCWKHNILLGFLCPSFQRENAVVRVCGGNSECC